MRSATWLGRWLQEKSTKPQSTGESVHRLWPALESNAYLSNSEKGAGLTHPFNCGFTGTALAQGFWERSYLINMVIIPFTCLT